MREARLRGRVEALFGRPETSVGEARRRGVRAAIVRGSLVVVASGAAASLAGVASAAVVCGSGTPSTAGTTAACAYTASGQDAFTVPAGVTSVDVTAVGAGGGIGDSASASPGLGASVQDAAVPVTAGQVLGVVVGGPGTREPNSLGVREEARAAAVPAETTRPPTPAVPQVEAAGVAIRDCLIPLRTHS